jgi:hypothetical protein
MHVLGHRGMMPMIIGVPSKQAADMVSRLCTKLESTRSFWATSFASTTSGTRFSVGPSQSRHASRGCSDVSIVASKCGFDAFGDGGVTNSAAHIKEYIEGTIERLGFTPDLYYLHRIDPSKFGTIRDGNGLCADICRHAS